MIPLNPLAYSLIQTTTPLEGVRAYGQQLADILHIRMIGVTGQLGQARIRFGSNSATCTMTRAGAKWRAKVSTPKGKPTTLTVAPITFYPRGLAALIKFLNMYELGLKTVSLHPQEITDAYLALCGRCPASRMLVPTEAAQFIRDTATAQHFNPQPHIDAASSLIERLHPVLSGYHVTGEIYSAHIHNTIVYVRCALGEQAPDTTAVVRSDSIDIQDSKGDIFATIILTSHNSDPAVQAASDIMHSLITKAKRDRAKK